MHAENGFLKIFPQPKVENGEIILGGYKAEASYSHPFGMNEFEFGSVCNKNGESILSLVAHKEEHFQRP